MKVIFITTITRLTKLHGSCHQGVKSKRQKICSQPLRSKLQQRLQHHTGWLSKRLTERPTTTMKRQETLPGSCLRVEKLFRQIRRRWHSRQARQLNHRASRLTCLGRQSRRPKVKFIITTSARAKLLGSCLLTCFARRRLEPEQPLPKRQLPTIHGLACTRHKQPKKQLDSSGRPIRLRCNKLRQLRKPRGFSESSGIRCMHTTGLGSSISSRPSRLSSRLIRQVPHSRKKLLLVSSRLGLMPRWRSRLLSP
mmetsp:Transcript_10952/g.19527  ORF Transcript_10952/g.19527 Transcript_10952/m.19527 type:complete len:252 (+) Transcript_10952:501-1256(+)